MINTCRIHAGKPHLAVICEVSLRIECNFIHPRQRGRTGSLVGSNNGGDMEGGKEGRWQGRKVYWNMQRTVNIHCFDIKSWMESSNMQYETRKEEGL